MNKLLTILIVLSFLVVPVLGDYKLSQRISIEGNGQVSTVWVKGVRIRTSMKMEIAGMSEAERQMMESMMPPLTSLSQCDLKQDVQINEKNRSYFVDYYDWSSVPPEKLARRPKQKVVVRGTVTMSSVVTDSGKRQKMFGLNARWLKHVVEMESSADSCDGAKKVRLESEGWFADLRLNGQSCPTYVPPGEDGGCRPRPIYKTMQDPGFLLEGTRTSFENGKKAMAEKVETLDVSTAPLDQALFEIPTGYTEVDSMADLIKRPGGFDNSAITVMSGAGTSGGPAGTKPKSMKTVAIDFIAGSSSKLDQNQIREYVSSKLSAAGVSGYLVSSQAELTSANFSNVITIDVTKLKESGAAKIGGLFGKVTGNTDSSKIGETEAEITMSLIGQDRKTVVASATAPAKIKGGPNDAVRAAIDAAFPQILAKLK